MAVLGPLMDLSDCTGGRMGQLFQGIDWAAGAVMFDTRKLARQTRHARPRAPYQR